MASGGEPRRADVADNLTLADPLAHPNDVPGRMVVAGGDIPSADVAVVDHQPVAITSVVVPLSHPAGTWGTDRRTTASAEVGAIVEFPVVQHRMEPHAERRCDASRHREREAVAGIR